LYADITKMFSPVFCGLLE